MTKPFESLDETFNTAKVEEEVVDITPVEPAKLETVAKKSDREKDYEYSRGQLYNVIEKMQETLNGAMDVASESDHPRAFEVAFNGAKHLADVVDKLQDLHKKQKDLDEKIGEVGGGQVNNGTVNNVYMTGTTADMLKMLKEAQQEDNK